MPLREFQQTLSIPTLDEIFVYQTSVIMVLKIKNVRPSFSEYRIGVVSGGFDVVESLFSTTCPFLFFYLHICVLMYDANYLNNGNQFFVQLVFCVQISTCLLHSRLTSVYIS